MEFDLFSLKQRIAQIYQNLYICKKHSFLRLRGFIRNLTASSLLILFIGYFSSITFFGHTHHIDNGIIIVHSHPFRSSGSNGPVQHQHTSAGFALIYALNNFLTIAAAAGFAVAAIRALIFCLLTFSRELDFSNPAWSFSYVLRGPPVKYTI
jgi:hypothetical protein